VHLRVSITDGGAVVMMVSQVPFIPCKSPPLHCTDTHEQYYGFSTDQSQPWKTHNIAREREIRPVRLYYCIMRFIESCSKRKGERSLVQKKTIQLLHVRQTHSQDIQDILTLHKSGWETLGRVPRTTFSPEPERGTSVSVSER
jgi:hypothetical protein